MKASLTVPRKVCATEAGACAATARPWARPSRAVGQLVDVERGEDAADHRDAQRAADLPGRVVDRRAGAGLLGPDHSHDRVGGRRRRSAAMLTSLTPLGVEPLVMCALQLVFRGVVTTRRGIERCETLAHLERESGENPGLSRSGMQERAPSSALARKRSAAGKRRSVGASGDARLRVRRPANCAGCAAPGGASPRGSGVRPGPAARSFGDVHSLRP
jgi:hypothetical protein